MRWDDDMPADFNDTSTWGRDARIGINDTLVTNEKGQKRLTSFSGHERNKMFINDKGRYFDISTLSGLDNPADGRAFCYWDYDRDGWLDVVLVNGFNPLLNLYRNRMGDVAEMHRNIVALSFVGGNSSNQPNPNLSCRDGYGVHVEFELAGRKIVREFRCGEGFAAQNSATLIVGIGENESVDAIMIEWPSGKKQLVKDVSAGKRITVFEIAKESANGSGTEVSDYLASEL